MNIHPFEAEFGAEVTGVDLRVQNEEAFADIYSAWLNFGVLRFRDQPLDDEALQAFSARFGPLEEMPLGLMPEEWHRKINNRFVTVLSNIMVDGKPIGGLGNGEANWHSDMTYVDDPPPASVLLGVEIPARGGDTHFADQCTACDVLPEALRKSIVHLNIKHDAAHTSVGSLRPGYDTFEDPRDAPGTVHPIVLEHEETGRSCLYLGRREWAYVTGLTFDESESLLDELWSYAILEENQWRQRWRAHDVVVWDNRRVLHRRDGFDANHRRMIRRGQGLKVSAVPPT